MLGSWSASRSLPLWITGTGVQPGCRDSENFPVDSLQPGLGDPRTFNVWSCEETSKGPWSPSFPGGPSVLPDTRPAPLFPFPPPFDHSDLATSSCLWDPEAFATYSMLPGSQSAPSPLGSYPPGPCSAPCTPSQTSSSPCPLRSLWWSLTVTGWHLRKTVRAAQPKVTFVTSALRQHLAWTSLLVVRPNGLMHLLECCVNLVGVGTSVSSSVTGEDHPGEAQRTGALFHAHLIYHLPSVVSWYPFYGWINWGSIWWDLAQRFLSSNSQIPPPLPCHLEGTLVESTPTIWCFMLILQII